MIVRCWGARGSISVSGKEYVKYGGDTSCIEIRTQEEKVIIVDAGSGIRGLGNQLLEERRFEYSLLFTHAHWDHVIGFPFFKPIYHPGVRMEIFGCPFVATSAQEMLSRILRPPNFPLTLADLRAHLTCRTSCVEPFEIGSMRITPIPLSHPDGGGGYRFEEDGKSFVLLTDNELTYRHPGGLSYEDYIRFCEGADLLIHDAEYTEADYLKKKAWGHTVYRDALRLAMDAGVAKLGLFHHNQDRTDSELDAMVEDCRRSILLGEHRLDCFALQQEMEIYL
ncbi:Phosphoribosyl 1,2-cyclic phosphodiesterase [Syntrophus gentianae]|uniref:Phosphoribosyl 1,2-cyclic phosphodiesterase n=1 Tax=Syntrophus gentianae TaxID=43775 RepID=A0A1H8A6Q6_9BACT|nr:MBL fold metallo-hydrolase [Syntrophus gentianae]SEM66243.1 Phosphoribosyl 1,2-cyclic phosphodiesterase [Syntrophus gentianae]